jgi:DNA repair exonuclease SbcCD ATPase subunit
VHEHFKQAYTVQSHLEQMTEKVRLLETELALHADLKQLETTLRAQLRAKETALEEAKDGMNKAQTELIKYKEEAETRAKVLIKGQQTLATKLRDEQKLDEKVSELLRQRIEDSSTARMLKSDLAAAKKEVCSDQRDPCQSCRVLSRVSAP